MSHTSSCVLHGIALSVLALFAQSAAPFGVRAQSGVEKSLTSKDPAQRLEGVALLVTNGGPLAEDQLRKATGDKDWEVALRATEALGTRGTTKSVKLLVDLAVEAPLERIRQASAASAKALDAAAAEAALVPRLKGDEILRVLEAMGRIPSPTATKVILKQLKSTEPAIRRAAVVALGASGDSGTIASLSPLLKDGDHSLVVAVFDALALSAQPEAVALLLTELKQPDLRDVMERAILRAIVQAVSRSSDPATCVATCRALLKEKGSVVPARAARLLSSLAKSKIAAVDAKVLASDIASDGLGSAAVPVRAASVLALSGLGIVDVHPKLVPIAEKDPAQKLRLLALRALVALSPSESLEAVKRGLSDTEAEVREEAAVLAARAKLRTLGPELLGKLGDADWKVASAAAISLGKLQDASAVPALITLAGHAEWRRRASGVAGLGLGGRKEAVAVLVERLSDTDPVVRATAHQYLKRLTNEKHKLEPKIWARWWQANADGFRFVDRFASDSKPDAYGRDEFRRNPYATFKDIDVIVLAEERDQIQLLLKDLNIAHTLTRTGQVAESGIHPNVVFMVNCPGQIQGDDGERLEWLVRSGGHLISSCWGLTNTVAKTFPGFVVAHPQGKSPPGAVDAFVAAPDSPFLRDVFDATTRPLYQLAGYQLISVLDRERVEVLIDSPAALTSFGEGNLAAHFGLGHGEVFQSTNHFALQGLKRERFKTEDQRTVYAIERLGIDFERIRELKSKGILADQNKAGEACDDLTVMRLIARFVQIKRNLEQQ